MTRRVCVVTGTRAEFGLLRWLMHEIRETTGLELKILATGTHLSPEFGQTYREIEECGFTIDARVEMLLSGDTATALTKSMGVGLIGFADAYARLAPDIIVVLGDRFEIFAATAAALIARIPVAHLHGGETTEGAFDESLRHSITKMAHLHFVGADEYRRRVIQLGEQPDRVFLVGGLGVDAIKRIDLLEREALEDSLDFKLGTRNLLVTFHPVTLDGEASSIAQMTELLAALDSLRNTHLIFTLPNADTGGRELAAMVNAFVSIHPNSRAYTSLGQRRYLSCMKYVDAVVGNSSSGLAEAPSMGIATINIGDRQRGRLQAKSIVNCPPQRDAILKSIHDIYDPVFSRTLPAVKNPYGDGGAAKRIACLLESYPLSGIMKKTFHDIIFQI